MASMNTRLNIEKLDGNIVQKHGGSKQVGFKQLGPGVETGVHGVHDEKRVWFEVELQGAQGDREAEVFQVSNDDTAVAQRRLEDKQPEEKTNTDCLVKEQEKEYQTGWKIKTGNVLDSCNQRSTQQYKSDDLRLSHHHQQLDLRLLRYVRSFFKYCWPLCIKQGMLEPVKVKCIFLGYRKGIVGNKLWRLDDVTSKVQCRCCKELSLRWNHRRIIHFEVGTIMGNVDHVIGSRKVITAVLVSENINGSKNVNYHIFVKVVVSLCQKYSVVDALRVIGRKLGKRDWNFDEDPCGWLKTSDIDNVTCNCDSMICHVASISLKRQGLPGTLPPEFADLPYLQNIDLTLNFLNGTIPPEWGSMQRLVSISLLGNRVTGSIPKELGNIITLKSLTVDDNMMSGKIPEELGSLASIERLFLNGNNFTGELPASFANLNALKDFRIGGSSLSGKIPEFIGNWNNLSSLRIQASGLEGPIPSNITLLPTLTDLRISDLNGPDTLCPPFINTTSFKHLILINYLERSYYTPLHINCGGEGQVLFENKTYEDDANPGEAANFQKTDSRWGLSNTGHFLDDNNDDNYIVPSAPGVLVNSSKLYKSARISALSLTYYGLCMHNGSYNGMPVEKDFDISNEAGGSARDIEKLYSKMLRTTIGNRLYCGAEKEQPVSQKEEYMVLSFPLFLSIHGCRRLHQALVGGVKLRLNDEGIGRRREARTVFCVLAVNATQEEENKHFVCISNEREGAGLVCWLLTRHRKEDGHIVWFRKTSGTELL
ncbi:probable leucine-rich repeat receptor-like serine/threonine-protein kinase [Tanacetum coccineum]